MERLLTLAGAFGLSLIVALVAAWRLVEHFWYGEDLDLFVPPLAGFVLVATLIFGLAYARAQSSRAFGMVAIALVAAALVIVATPFLAEYVAAQSKNPEVVLRPRSGKIKTVLLIPDAPRGRGAMVVRAAPLAAGAGPRPQDRVAVDHDHRGLRRDAEPDRARDPQMPRWRNRSTDWLRGLWLIVALIFGGIVLLVGLIEWGIRVRKRRKSLAPQGP